MDQKNGKYMNTQESPNKLTCFYMKTKKKHRMTYCSRVTENIEYV